MRYRLACLMLLVLPARSLAGTFTTYGVDPIPDSHRLQGSINLGYGIDPIPAKSPLQRWREWRAMREAEGRAHGRSYPLPPVPGYVPPRQDPARPAAAPAYPKAGAR